MGILVGDRDRERQEGAIVLALPFLCSDVWSLAKPLFLLECGPSHGGPKLSLLTLASAPHPHSPPRREVWQSEKPYLLS